MTNKDIPWGKERKLIDMHLEEFIDYLTHDQFSPLPWTWDGEAVVDAKGDFVDREDVFLYSQILERTLRKREQSTKERLDYIDEVENVSL